jgi:hypothetical protein
MRSDSQSGPDTAVLDKLKFDLPCDRVLAFRVLRPIRLWRCKRPARWATTNHCCAEVMLSCGKHRETIGKCARCKLVRSLPRWSRI